MSNAATTWTVVVFGSAGETRRHFFYESEARGYAARARASGCLARVQYKSITVEPVS